MHFAQKPEVIGFGARRAWNQFGAWASGLNN
jgi:hypothetical protein